MSLLLKKWNRHRGWIFLNLPFFIMAVLLLITPSLYKPLTSWTAYIATGLFCGLLMLNPLRNIFATSKILRELNNHRRILGVAVFNYALLHVICFVIKRGSIMATFKWLAHPVILPGFIAFLILIPLAITSNKISLKYLKFLRWKKLHNMAYIAEIGIFIHMVLRGGNTTFYALLLFIPLVVLQTIRRRRHRHKKR